jgi:hypothetical protein
LWTQDADRTLAYLMAPDAGVRMRVIELTCSYLNEPLQRRRFAQAALSALRQGKPNLEAVAQVARMILLDELVELLSLREAVSLIASGSPVAQALAAEVLAHRPDAAAELGLERLVAMAEHELAAVRAAAHRLLLRGRCLAEQSGNPLGPCGKRLAGHPRRRDATAARRF